MTETLQCAECGKVVKRNAVQQKYCAECSHSRHVRQTREMNLRKKKEREAAAAAETERQEQETAREAMNTLTLDGKRTARIVAEARAFGMSYGTYTAAIRDGSIRRVLRAKGFTDPEAVLRGLTIK